MLVPCCHTSLVHFKYTSVASNESDMSAQAKTKSLTFRVNATTLMAKAKTYKAETSSH